MCLAVCQHIFWVGIQIRPFPANLAHFFTIKPFCVQTPPLSSCVTLWSDMNDARPRELHGGRFIPHTNPFCTRTTPWTLFSIEWRIMRTILVWIINLSTMVVAWIDEQMTTQGMMHNCVSLIPAPFTTAPWWAIILMFTIFIQSFFLSRRHFVMELLTRPNM